MLYVFKQLENRERERERKSLCVFNTETGKTEEQGLTVLYVFDLRGVDRLYLHYGRPQEQKKLILFEHFTGKH